MSQSIAVVCEARGDFEMCCALVERVIEAHRPEWYADYTPADLVQYRGFRPTDEFIAWPWINKLAKEHGLHSPRVLRGGYSGEFPTDPIALEVLRALRLLQVNIPTPDAVVFVKDTDNKPERRTALQQLHGELSGHAVPVVVGAAHPERECWFLAGFLPENPTEQAALDTLCRSLSLHPCRESHRLASPNETDERHPKFVLRILTNGDPAREAACLRATFQVLEENGRDNGLADFLHGLRDRLIHQLFGGPPPEAQSG